MKNLILLLLALGLILSGCKTTKQASQTQDATAAASVKTESQKETGTVKDSSGTKKTDHYQKTTTRPGETLEASVGLEALKAKGAVITSKNGLTSVLSYNQQTGEINQHTTAPPVNEHISHLAELLDYREFYTNWSNEQSARDSLNLVAIRTETEKLKEANSAVPWWVWLMVGCTVVYGTLWVLETFKPFGIGRKTA